MKKAFTLVEIMISFAILTGIVVGVAAIYGNLANLSKIQREEAERNTDIAIACTMIEKDIKMAGFATPNITRFASFNGASDMLFMADGWEIMRDYTDNGYDDGTISDEFYGTLSESSLGGEGYAARLRKDAETGTTQIEIISCNVNPGAIRDDRDFKDNTSLIIGVRINQGEHRIEGCRIRNVDCSHGSITLGTELQAEYLANSTIVTPAICYYIAQFEGRNWLYRNGLRVIPAENLQVEYGYDDNPTDRILMDNEWRPELPDPYNPRLLRAIRVNLGIRPYSKVEKLATYTVSSELRN